MRTRNHDFYKTVITTSGAACRGGGALPLLRQYHSRYAEEVERHEQTKLALNKAIKLANILLDEITHVNRHSSAHSPCVS
jgi:hypothetical protein